MLITQACGLLIIFYNKTNRSKITKKIFRFFQIFWTKGWCRIGLWRKMSMAFVPRLVDTRQLSGVMSKTTICKTVHLLWFMNFHFLYNFGLFAYLYDIYTYIIWFK